MMYHDTRHFAAIRSTQKLPLPGRNVIFLQHDAQPLLVVTTGGTGYGQLLGQKLIQPI